MSRSRSSRKTSQDLELRLVPAYLSKGGMLGAGCLRDCPDFVTIEDGEDYEQIFPAVSSGEVHAQNQTFRSFPYSSQWAPAIREEDLELRLGVGASNGYSGNSSGGANTLEHRFKNPNAWQSGKASSSQYMSVFEMHPKIVRRGEYDIHPNSFRKEVKLRCAICMDTMKEETSTLCGHVFCKACITNTIRVQKRCPTCREKLSISNIHRIYLPGAAS